MYYMYIIYAYTYIYIYVLDIYIIYILYIYYLFIPGIIQEFNLAVLCEHHLVMRTLQAFVL